MFVCLTEEKAASWWRFKEFGGEQSSKTVAVAFSANIVVLMIIPF